MDNSIKKYCKECLGGSVKFYEPLHRHTTFRIGGPCDIWAQPRDFKDFGKIISLSKHLDLPILVIGGGSNILVTDKGLRSILVCFADSKFFCETLLINSNLIKVGAGCTINKLQKFLLDNDLSGLEFMSLIPGTVAGAIFMNSGSANNFIGGLVEKITIVDMDGNMKELHRKRIKFGYRSSNLEQFIIIDATLRFKKERHAVILDNIEYYKTKKMQTQELSKPSAGCVFKNPIGTNKSSAELIDSLGLKGLSIGGASVSRKHANFIVNDNGASSRDVLALIDLIRNRIQFRYNINLELEIKIWGD